MLSDVKKILFFVVGILSLALGFIGIFVPILPTTPFVLLAAFCFARSSPRFNYWLRSSRVFGPLIVDWEDHGMIRLRSKWIATLVLLLSISIPLFRLGISVFFKSLIVLTAVSVLLFIWSRPSTPKLKSNIRT